MYRDAKVQSFKIKERRFNGNRVMFPDFEYNLRNIKAKYKEGVLTVFIMKSMAVQQFRRMVI